MPLFIAGDRTDQITDVSEFEVQLAGKSALSYMRVCLCTSEEMVAYATFFPSIVCTSGSAWRIANKHHHVSGKDLKVDFRDVYFMSS